MGKKKNKKKGGAKAADVQVVAPVDEPPLEAPPPPVAAGPEQKVDAEVAAFKQKLEVLAPVEDEPNPGDVEAFKQKLEALSPSSTKSGFGVPTADLGDPSVEAEVHKPAPPLNGGGTSLGNRAFVFIKPHAVTEMVKQEVSSTLKAKGCSIVSEGSITSEVIDADKLVDQHYYAIASKATILKPEDLNVDNKKFKDQFGLDWQDVLGSGKAYNALDGCVKLGLSPDEMDEQWGICKKSKKLVKLGGGFYCGLIEIKGKEPIYVFNGFFMSMRNKFTAPGLSIYYYVVDFDPAVLPWADFRGKVLGPTDPAEAPADSLRGVIMKSWSSLGLETEPNVGDNGVHASASPFEALCERMNWLKEPLTLDPFGTALLHEGISIKWIEDGTVDPQVMVDGAKGSLWDAVEDMDAAACVQMLKSISSAAPPEPEPEPESEPVPAVTCTTPAAPEVPRTEATMTPAQMEAATREIASQLAANAVQQAEDAIMASAKNTAKSSAKTKSPGKHQGGKVPKAASPPPESVGSSEGKVPKAASPPPASAAKPKPGGKPLPDFGLPPSPERTKKASKPLPDFGLPAKGSPSSPSSPGSSMRPEAMWAIADKNNDGKLSKTELKRAMSASPEIQAFLGMRKPDSKKLKDIFVELDADLSGDISREEFLQKFAMAKKQEDAFMARAASMSPPSPGKVGPTAAETEERFMKRASMANLSSPTLASPPKKAPKSAGKPLPDFGLPPNPAQASKAAVKKPLPDFGLPPNPKAKNNSSPKHSPAQPSAPAKSAAPSAADKKESPLQKARREAGGKMQEKQPLLGGPLEKKERKVPGGGKPLPDFGVPVKTKSRSHGVRNPSMEDMPDFSIKARSRPSTPGKTSMAELKPVPDFGVTKANRAAKADGAPKAEKPEKEKRPLTDFGTVKAPKNIGKPLPDFGVGARSSAPKAEKCSGKPLPDFGVPVKKESALQKARREAAEKPEKQPLALEKKERKVPGGGKPLPDFGVPVKTKSRSHGVRNPSMEDMPDFSIKAPAARPARATHRDLETRAQEEKEAMRLERAARRAEARDFEDKFALKAKSRS